MTGGIEGAALQTPTGIAVVPRRDLRAAAAISGLEVLATVAKMFGAHPGFGSNVFVAGLMVWVSVRAVQATWALERMPDEDEEEEEVPAAARRR